ncbi:MAG TPA: NRDE family protein [Verrucomicrobiae bacterium]|nr:NRDE family protein [Verrucomicrobiae bacterium]
MCTLAAFVGAFPGWPLVVAANRDEYLARPAAPPALLREMPPRAFGGRDLAAGGTWLGVAETGLVAGMLNRRSATPPDPACRSRGQLCLDLLGCASATAAAARVAAEPRGRYNPFNLLVADRDAAFVVSQPRGEPPRAQRLAPGLHLLTNLDLDDPTCPRIAASHRGFAAAGDAFTRDGEVDALVARLQTVLAEHAIALDPRGPGSLCVHVGPFGTRSSSLLLVPAGAEPVRYFHADGPPCRTRLEALALPF